MLTPTRPIGAPTWYCCRGAAERRVGLFLCTAAVTLNILAAVRPVEAATVTSESLRPQSGHPLPHLTETSGAPESKD